MLSFIKSGLLIPIEQRFIPFNLFLFFSNETSILTPSKLDSDILSPITFQSVTILNVWRVICHVHIIENFEGSFLQIIVTNSIWNTGDFKHSRLGYWLFPNIVSLMQPLVRATCYLHFFETGNSDSLKSLRSSFSSLLILDNIK